ncbi:MAG: DNA polymerase III subunit gamma/tau [Acidimicrobiales bacterium]|nr:DNA polymerase III subunit gamma/tau [Acidimicrobiales bacterium]
MAYQSLYRRFRPQTFSEVIGQDHLVAALRNALAEDRVGHAYLLSGPRGTGKTSTARILAKALNCTDPPGDGEPCGECESCISVELGNSMDLVELDAASNNSVANVREITANAALGSPGKRKVYLLDEVHMLTAAASNALLKTLEEPPDHVVFVLATTDPQKVLPTIRSRTQHIELNLIPADVLTDHVRHVALQADLQLDPEVVEYVVGRGAGSVRDTLSALDQVLAAGGIPNARVSVDALISGIANQDLTASMAAIAQTVAAGIDPRDLTERATRALRDVFLAGAGVNPGQATSEEMPQLAEQAAQMGRATNVRALELLGHALVGMRQASDPRLVLDLALVQLFAESPEDRSSSTAAQTTSPPSGSAGKPAAAARAALAATPEPGPSQETEERPATPPPVPSNSDAQAPPPQAGSQPAAEPQDEVVESVELSASEISEVLQQRVLPKLGVVARALFDDATLAEVAENTVQFKITNATLQDRFEQLKTDLEKALSDSVGVKVHVEFVLSTDNGEKLEEPPEEVVDPADFKPTNEGGPSSVDKVLEAFPGAVASDDDGTM